MALPEDRQKNLDLNKKVLAEFQVNRWRDLRKNKLRELDVEFLLALEDLVNDIPGGDKTKINSIIEKKKNLRDITNYDFSDIDDETKIQEMIPDILL